MVCLAWSLALRLNSDHDVSTFFHEVMTKKFPGKKCFLVGE